MRDSEKGNVKSVTLPLMVAQLRKKMDPGQNFEPIKIKIKK